MQEIIIGRLGNQPFKIEDSCAWVHREHAKIIINDFNQWIIEDLKNGEGNGVYVRNDKGVFEKVLRQPISPEATIRLGKEGTQSYTFMAQKVLSQNATGYSAEFRAVKRLSAELHEEEERLEEKLRKHNMIKSVVPSIGMALLMLPMDKIGNPLWLRGLIGVLTIICLWSFRKDPDKMKKLRLKKENLLVCPKCGRPLSKYDIKMCQCSYCKAK